MRLPALLLALLLGWPQDPPKPAPPVPAPAPATAPQPVYTALVGGDLQTVAHGLLKGATLLIKDSKIHRIGTDVEIPEGATRIDVRGMVVMPGLVAVSARNLGVGGSSPRLSDALNPFQQSIQLALAAGVTTAYVQGGGGGHFGDRTEGAAAPSAVIKMTWGDLDAMTVLEPASVPLSSAVTGTGSQKYEVRENLKKAAELLAKIRDYELRRSAGRLAPNEQPPAAGPLDPFVRVLRGDTVARFEVSSAEEIAAVLSLCESHRIRALLIGAEEAWTMAEELGRAHLLCAITPRRFRPRNRRTERPSGSRFDQPALLRKAGVKFAILPLTDAIDTGGIAGRDLACLPMEAAYAVRGGLDEKTAIEGITLAAAEAIGLADRIGSLEEGKDADLAIFDRDPLDYRAMVQKTFVNGKLLYEIEKSPWFAHFKKK